jgi:hypothetical protein
MTTTYQTIKAKQQKDYDELLTNHKVFWAFNQSQLEEGKAKIGVLDNKDLTSIGGGGFLPKANADAFMADMAKLSKAHTKELREAKQAKEEAILYELNNHECWYSGSIDPVVELFAGVYTKDDIKKVYLKYANQNNNN